MVSMSYQVQYIVNDLEEFIGNSIIFHISNAR